MGNQVGLAKPEAAKPAANTSITDGWHAFMDYSGRSPVLGGVSANTSKRYRAVRDKHTKFCAEHGIATWAEFDKAALEKYGNWLSRKFAYRTSYFELTLLKSVNGWLIENKKLPADAKIVYPLSKPQGTDTYCYTREEVVAMVKHCQATLNLGWLACVIIALAHLGVRIGELAGLRWTDVDLQANMVTVADERASRRKKLAGTARTTKGKRSRKIPIHPHLCGDSVEDDAGCRWPRVPRRAWRSAASQQRAARVHPRRDREAQGEVPHAAGRDGLRAWPAAFVPALLR